MLASIAPIAPVVLPAVPSLSGDTTMNSAGGFQNVLQAAMQHAANSSTAADNAVQNYLSGGDAELHSTILATQSADLDLQLLLQVRNKIVSAYEEIMKMQI